MANWFFDGARADIAKVVSANPAFQLTHAFSLGSASKPASYNFGAIFANAQVCRLQLHHLLEESRLRCVYCADLGIDILTGRYRWTGDRDNEGEPDLVG